MNGLRCWRLSGGVILIGTLVWAAQVSPAGSAARAKITKTYPIVDLQSRLLLGAPTSSGWRNAARTVPQIRGGETYRLYGLKGRVGTVTGSKAGKTDPEMEGQFEVTLSPALDTAEEALAISAPWNPMPRFPRRLDPNGAAYRKILADYLRQKGMKNPKLNILQLYRVDLEGDGTDEVILTAGNPGTQPIPPHAEQGFYSVALLRKVVNGKVKTISLGEDFHPKAEREGTWQIPTYFRLHSVLDLNGDGRMEIVMRSGYYEGDGVTAYTLEKGRLKPVLEAFFGV